MSKPTSDNGLCLNLRPITVITKSKLIAKLIEARKPQYCFMCSNHIQVLNSNGNRQYKHIILAMLYMCHFRQSVSIRQARCTVPVAQTVTILW